MRTVLTTPISTKIAQLTLCLALGALAGVGLTDASSAMERNRCKQLTASHRVLTLPSFWGQVTHCIDRRYL